MRQPEPTPSPPWSAIVTDGVAVARRVMQLWRVQAYLDFLFMTRSLSSFLGYILGDGIATIGAISTTYLLAERFNGIGAWSKFQIIFMLGYAIVVRGLLETVLGYNVLYISRRLGRGQLDHLLIQPRPLWMALITEGFTPWSQLISALPGLGLMVWALNNLPPLFSPIWLGWLLLNVLASAIIAGSFSYLWGSLAFFAPEAAEEISTSALRLMEGLKPFPLDAVPTALVIGLTTLVPAGLIAWYPSRALLGIDQWGLAPLLTPVAAGIAVVLAAWFFRRGLAQYERRGSQRYLSFGHRR